MSSRLMELHVAADASPGGDGSRALPFCTINDAAAVAGAGDTITIHAGTYRERVTPPRGGTDDDHRVTYQAAEGDRPVVTGSEIATGWHNVDRGVWRLHLPNAYFGDFKPYREVVRGDWFDGGSRTHLRGTVFRGDQALPQAESLTALFELRRPSWWAQVGSHTTEILGYFDSDPNDGSVEITVRPTVFTPDKPHVDFLTIRGLNLRNAATNWAAPTAGQEGLVTALWCRGWVIEDNEVSGSRCCGIALAKYADEWDGRRGDTEGYYLTIEDARRAGGWSKETVGSHVIRRNRIHDCGQTGIVGSLGCAFSQIEGNEVFECNTGDVWSGAEMAGIKLHGAIDTVIDGNHIHHNAEWAGLWLDWMAQGTIIRNNVFHHNDSDSRDLFLEVSHGPVLVANNIFLSRRAYMANTSGVAFVHNLIAGELDIRHDDRHTPVLEPHGTAHKGMQRCYVGDTHWVNNVLLGPADLRALNGDLARWPSVATGNVFVNGAHSSEWDTEDVHASADTAPHLERRPDGWHLTFDQNPGWRHAASRTLAKTETLGEARVPEQPYTNPDGSDVHVNDDFFGISRDPSDPFPGPFEHPSPAAVQVWPRFHDRQR